MCDDILLNLNATTARCIGAFHGVIEAMQERLDRDPETNGVRRQTEHRFGRTNTGGSQREMRTFA